MRLGIATALLVGVASFVLAACNDRPDGDTSSEQPQQVEIEFDFDTKTKTVTAPPPAIPTIPTYRPATPTTKRPVATTGVKPRTTR